MSVLKRYNGVSWDEVLASFTSTVTITLTSSGWINNQQTVLIDNLPADGYIIVSPSPESFTSYSENNVYYSSQTSGSLTFTCRTVPESDLIVNIMVLR